MKPQVKRGMSLGELAGKLLDVAVKRSKDPLMEAVYEEMAPDAKVAIAHHLKRYEHHAPKLREALRRGARIVERAAQKRAEAQPR
jgi:cytochrome c553